jgi:Fe-S oxidoreductase
MKQTRAMVKLLNSAGVSFAVLGEQEGCTGDPARRAGNEMLFQMQAETNIETLNEAGVKKIIASCPHCMHTLRHDYAQFGGNYDVIHHSQLIAGLLREGRLKLQRNGTSRVTYHDSCYLGRWNRIFEPPREILRQVPMLGQIVELGRNRRHGFCCGAGGARMFVDEEPPRINTNRADEVIAAGIDTVAVACPFCNIMLTDGMKERDKDEDIRILDVAEIVAQRLPDK